MRDRRHMLPVWFFIGLLLTMYGIVILITGVSEWSHPPAVVLSQYHPGVWGGILLLVIGGFYVLRFRPKPPKQEERDSSMPPLSAEAGERSVTLLSSAEDGDSASHRQY